jgi:hypothetical protein
MCNGLKSLRHVILQLSNTENYLRTSDLSKNMNIDSSHLLYPIIAMKIKLYPEDI